MKLIVLMISVVSLFGCIEEQQVQSAHNEEEKTVQQDAENGGPVLATVDGIPVYQTELDILLHNLFGEDVLEHIDEKSAKRALDSLIASLVLSRRAAAELPAEQLKNIDIKTMRYRENQLINAYMKTKLETTPISFQQVTDYYNDNLEKFGKTTIKQYQLLTIADRLTDKTREHFLNTVSSLKQKATLEMARAALKVQGYKVSLTTAILNKKILDKRLYQFIDQQPVGEISELNLVQGKPYMVKVLSQQTIPARPLQAVTETIRESLLYAKLKQAIKKQSDEALARADIVYQQRIGK